MLVRHRSFTPAFDRSIDQAFEQLTSSFFEPRRAAGPVVDGSWSDGEYVLTVDLPGVPAEAVTVEVTGSMLMLGATIGDTEWQRSLRLGNRLDPEQVSARHVDGRLTVRIGTYAEPEARKIAIDTSPQAAIEATSTDAESSESSESSDD